MIVGAKTPC